MGSILLALALTAALGLGIATLAVAQDGETLVVDTGAPVYAATCKVCHSVIAEGSDPRVQFRHATHMLFACSSCHTRFPHSPVGTIKPTMKDCWNCHDLRHGPMGLIAGGECEKCHGALAAEMRPVSHVADWAEVPHVAPAEAEMRTRCMMCHARADCDQCHREVGVEWQASEPYNYDVENGCLACHGDPNLGKTVAGAVWSLYVTGLDRTAHRDTTCVECHVDFKYHDGADRTPLWNINVGLACADCHEHSDAAKVWAASLHGELIAEGDYNSATCSSCHGGHSIARLDTEAARRRLHRDSEQMCAICHTVEWENYDDYYHGRAYKRGASDAPACWDCHGAHEVLAVADPESMVYPTNAVDTCGTPGCHWGSGESFIERSSYLIHGRYEAREGNPIIRWWRSLRGRG
ncbi:MAG: hypothetical protein IBX63_05915 [Coriobacteriia bacterium]|nr:hypothetical protein [Coriobacteriia bacterium]